MPSSQVCQYSNHCHLCELPLDRRDKRLRNYDLRPTADHVKPLSKGGANVRDNVLPAHHCCNNRKGNEPVTVELKKRLRTAVLKQYGFLIADLERELRRREWWKK